MSLEEHKEGKSGTSSTPTAKKGILDPLFVRIGVDAELAEWFFLNLFFAVIPLGLAITFRKIHHVAAIEVAANIPELSFCVIMVSLTAAGDIRKVITGNVRSTVFTIYFWILLFGAIIFAASLGIHLWNESAFSDDYNAAVESYANAVNQHRSLTDAAQELAFSRREYLKNQQAEIGLLDLLKTISGIFIGVSIIAEFFVARARAVEKAVA